MTNRFPTLPTDSSEQNGKAHIPEDPDPDPSSSDSSSNKSNLLNDRSSSKSIKNKRDEKKKRWKNKKQNLSDSLSSGSDFSYDSDHRRKQRKRKSHQKKDPIKLCSCLIGKLLTKVYKSKIIRFKLDEDPLQLRIYFLTFVESLMMIFPSIKKLVKYF